MKVVDGVYLSFDPEIYIDGSPVKYIGTYNPHEVSGSLDFCGSWFERN